MKQASLDILQLPLLINGQLKETQGGKCFDSINPSTGEVLAKVADASVEDMQNAIASAKAAFESWSGLSFKERGVYLNRIAQLIRENAKVLAELESLDVGKTSKQTTFIDVPTCADTFEYFATVGEELKSRVNHVPAPVESITEREPLGVVACIIPWNYPLIMSAWKVAPALIAGNTVILKPSSQASVSLLKLAQIIQESGLPKGVLNIVTTIRHEAATELVTHKDVVMVSFSGGTETGQEIMRKAAATTKKVILELGGKSANIVLADCDLEAAVGGVMSSIFMNQGQMCTAMSRLLVQDTIYDKFLELLIAKTKNLKIGSSVNFETDFGPVISRQHRDNILTFIEKAKKEGAKLACGGKVAQVVDAPNGFYIEPTIFTDVKNEMAIAQEEVFGPVLAVIKFLTEKEAIMIANDSRYGLAGGIWTKDVRKAKALAKQLQCGTVWINTYGGFYNQASFGGYKQSGFGRELGHEGLLEYTQTKHICTDQTPGGKSLVTSWF